MFEDASYWMSRPGLLERAFMIGEAFTFKVVNQSLIAYGGANDVWGFEWVGATDEATCTLCDKYIGHRYRLGMFLPPLPAHANCRCEWRIIVKGE